MASTALVGALLLATVALGSAQGSRPSASPVIVSGDGIATRGTCDAMQEIAEDLNTLGVYGKCSRGDDCTFVECVGDNDMKLSIVPCCQCDYVSGVQLEIKHEGKVYLDQVFVTTERVSVTIDGDTTVITVILSRYDGDLHLQVNVIEDSSKNFTAIPYTRVPYDSLCDGDTSRARCNAITSVMADLYTQLQYNCTHNSDCDEIDCQDDYTGDELKITLLPCEDPQAVRIVEKGIVPFDHTFSKSETIFIEVSEFGGFTVGIAVTLNHLENDRIGLQVDSLYNETTEPEAVIHYTVIPLDTSDCSDYDLGLIVGVTLGVLVLLLCCCCACICTCIVVCVVVARRQKKKQHGDRIRYEAMRPLADD